MLPIMPNIEEILTIDPELFFCINADAAFIPKKHPFEFTSFVLSQSASVVVNKLIGIVEEENK